MGATWTGSVGVEVSVQPVGCNVEVMVAARGHLVFTGSDDTKAIAAHQTAHTSVSNSQAYFLQLLGHSGAAIAT